MKLILCIPEEHSTWNKKLALMDVRVGGITLLERALKVLGKEDFDQRYALVPESIVLPSIDSSDSLFTRISYTNDSYLATIIQEIIDNMPEERVCLCVLDGVISRHMFVWEGLVGEYRMTIDGDPTCCWVLYKSTLAGLSSSLMERLATVQKFAECGENAYYQRIASKANCREGLSKVSKSLRRPMGFDLDGIITYHFVRPISLWISRRLANTPVTPNMVTITSMIFGIVGAILVALSGILAEGLRSWIFTVSGTFMWLFASILDGVDGELVRMRMTPTLKGEWLDTICDDVTHIVFFLALSFSICIAHNHNYLALIIGGASSFVLAISIALHYRRFYKSGVASYKKYYKLLKGEEKEVILDEHKISFARYIFAVLVKGIRWIVKRDFYTFIIFCLVLLKLDMLAYLFMLCSITARAIKGLIFVIVTFIKNSIANWRTKRALKSAKK